MAWLESQLAPGEQVVFRTRQHPAVLASSVTFALSVLGIVALLVVRNELSTQTITLLWVIGVAIALGSLVLPVLRWRASTFVVTDRRVLVRLGVLRPHRCEVALGRVEAIEVARGLAGGVLGYGRLRIGERGGMVEEFDRVADPERLRDAVAGQTRLSSPPRRGR